MEHNIIDNYQLNLNNNYQQQKLANHLPSSDSLAITKISTITKAPLLVIANDSYNANRLYDELHFFAPKNKIAIFPDSEILPYEKITPQPDLIAKRLSTLWQIVHNQLDIVIVSANTLQTKICPPNYLTTRVLLLKIADKLSLTKLREQLVSNDYALVDRVYQNGEFAIRGGTIDIMPMGSKQIVRIELFDDEIESLKLVDVTSNLTINSTNKIEIIPAREYPLDNAALDKFIDNFSLAFKEPQYSQWVDEIKTHRLPAGSEFYLPLFFDYNTATIFDYLSPHWQIVYYANTIDQLNANWQEIKRRYASYSYQYPCLAPNQLFTTSNDILELIKHYATFNISQSGILANGICQLGDLTVEHKKPQPFHKLITLLKSFTTKVYLVVNSLGRLEVLKNTLAQFEISSNLYPQLEIIQGLLYNGFICNQVAFITEYELYHQEEHNLNYQPKRHNFSTNHSAFNYDNIIKDLAEIKVGDHVIHINHGIGKYCGLTTREIEGISYDMLELEYQNEARLFIPVYNLHLISRYSAVNQENIQPSNLGSNSWQKTRLKVEKRIFDTATELLELYAKREIQPGFAFKLPQEYDNFAKQFGYEPTIDQENCFKEIINDMLQAKPMDRLICGDVGFGKTEVAMRAAFICAMNGKQVAILTPTTLLTEQHYENFINRFNGFPINISEISRFRSKKEITTTLDLVKSGQIDILIGTHRLIQNDVEFKNLGLIIIDEEHRFGVKQKERLKQLRANVDTLAMTATPIPRSLSMALDGIRDFSIIATAPQKRLAVTTIICNEDEQLIKEAMLREIRRGGQIFFLYNDVQTISQMYEKLRNIMPNLNIAVAHGQMKESDLEHTIRDFIRQKYNLLLCTTIIETGIDIANANTIFIYRADKLGLAQLHQLRGRVGRSHHQAYCYMIVPENTSKNSQRRLNAINMTSELGSGFNLAIHDLEIRGAGEILGDKQSGDIKEVGLSLYTEMLKKAVRKLKSSTTNNSDGEDISCTVDLNQSAILPDNYCHCVHQRLVYYRSLAKATTKEEIDLIYQDIINNNGLPPTEVTTLINSHYLRIKAVSLGIKALDIREKSISITFIATPTIAPNKIVALMQELKTCKMNNSHQLIWYTELNNSVTKFNKASYLLDYLSV
jgi:transcription-repair coupling factor (superfamily II helicase)